MFYGETTVAVDDKGRCAIPTAYRDSLSVLCRSQLVVTYSPYDNDCLWVLPRPEWERIRDEVVKLPSFEAAHRTMKRRLIGAASHLEMDGNGRIVLPHSARQQVGLAKSGVLLGMGAYFELWPEEAQRARMEMPIQGSEITDAMRQLSF